MVKRRWVYGWACLALGVACGDENTANAPPAPAPADAESPDGAPPRPGDGGVTNGDSDGDTSSTDADPWAVGPQLGARRLADGSFEVRVHAPNATRVELALFRQAFGEVEALRVPLARAGVELRATVDAATLAQHDLEGVLYYGLRAWGPNWPYDANWEPGSLAGFLADVDANGNRMNPNKLLLDPYALEVSHDPYNLQHGDGDVYQSGESTRALDSATVAPKGIVLAPATASEGAPGALPTRPVKDDVVYEVHLRGLTMNDASVPAAERGTYAGAARRAAYLRELGVTVVEFLPLHETPNDQNDRTPESEGDNYWGYSTSNFFAPDRRYAADRSPGGPTRELRAMIDAFHAEGIKVWVDVVYNHTAEGGAFAEEGNRAPIHSWRGLDNSAFYELADDPRFYYDSNGVGPNVNTANHVTANLVMASLRYWHEQLGVDGFRFDLASIVANGCTRGCYRFDRDGLVKRIALELPARPWAGGAGADLIAEPWGLAAGSYQLGAFPDGWSEWNDRFRDRIREDLNKLGHATPSRREIAARISGSGDIFGAGSRPPASSINFVSAHDGMTLFDVFSYDQKNNLQPWPFGPSDGGTDKDNSWSHGGDPLRQRTAARTAFALNALSAGVPMFYGGDERLRTQRGNNNAYNLDSIGNWMDWSETPASQSFLGFCRWALRFRREHPALRPAQTWAASALTWLRDDGQPANDGYLDASDRHFLAWQLDGQALGDPAPALLFAYNAWQDSVPFTLPPPPSGTQWALVADSSDAAESWGNVQSPVSAWTEASYTLGRRALAVFVAE